MNLAAIVPTLSSAALALAGMYTAKTSTVLHERALEYLWDRKDSDSHALVAAASSVSMASAIYFVASAMFAAVAVLAFKA